MIASVVASVVAAAKQRQKETAIGAIAAALLVVFVAVAYAWNSDRPGAAEQASALSGVSSPPAAPASVVSNRPVILANDPVPAPATASAGAIPLVTRSRPRIDDQRSAAKNTRGGPTGISIPKVPSRVMPGLDSVLRARGAPGSEVGESFIVQPPPLTVGSRPLTFEREDPVNQAQPARLIGTLPIPRIPGHLAGIEGEVRVRFTVDALGQPVISSLSVVSSSDKALTAAVLKVIPDLRFEPAQTGGADPKPVGDVVQLEFLFRPNK
jgi:TonB family protein